jgi:transglutaminase-like putative cysteine protease
MRLRVEHTTGYTYGTEVVSSYNEARLVPQTGMTQLTLSSAVTTRPDALLHRYWDYWGTQVTAFDIHVPHTSLEVTCTSVVDTANAGVPGDASWEDIAAVADEHIELIRCSPRTVADADLSEAAKSVTGTPYEVVLGLVDLVREKVVYVPGSTGVGTSAVEAWAQGKGVCQDIAHVTLALLREAGIPARYVSGYLHPAKEPEIGATVQGESHAWVEAWLGGWWAYDPTGGMPAGERHVIVAQGRDYTDVQPLKGVFSGGGDQQLGVSVLVTRLS